MRRCSLSSSIRTSVTARCSSSVALTDHLGMLDDARHRDDLVSAHDERPRLALGTGHLRVDEHVLDLPPPPGEPIARPPPSHSKPFGARADAPLAPAHLARELDRPALEPETVVLAHGLHAAAEVDAL